ncbi:MAG: hypothetical protein AAFR87_17855 [Bacteroidota bacterium]
MGIFDKIKKVKNFIGGGGATLQLIPGKTIFRATEDVKLKVVCHVKDLDLNIQSVYLKVKALEEVVIQQVERSHSRKVESETRKNDLRSSHQTFSTQIQLAPGQILKANQMYEWEASFRIPPHLNGTYRGYNAKHEWSVYVGLELTGNDPDSGWMNIEISK